MTPYSLTVAVLGALGIMTAVEGLSGLSVLLLVCVGGSDAPAAGWAKTIAFFGATTLVPLAIGGALFAARKHLARLVTPVADLDTGDSASLEDVQAAAYAVLAVGLAGTGVVGLSAVVATSSGGGLSDWREAVPELISLGLALALFCRGRALARLGLALGRGSER
ncbi:MAG: hypothetical protein AAF628_32545 [Planctomycetota bacterium]